MNKLNVAIAAVVLGVGVVGGRMVLRAHAFEQRASAAESAVAHDRTTIDSLLRDIAWLDAGRSAQTKTIVRVDSTSRPDKTCGPSLAARNVLIASDATEIADLHRTVTHLTADRDTLRSALASRPHGGVTLEFLHPSVHLSVQMMVYPVARIGIGVSFDLASIRL